MPAHSPSLIVDSPPPLTPEALQNFPYAVRTFPAQWISQALTIVRPPATDANAPPDDTHVE